MTHEPILDDGSRVFHYGAVTLRVYPEHVQRSCAAIRKRWGRESDAQELYGHLAPVIKLNTRKRKNNSSV